MMHWNIEVDCNADDQNYPTVSRNPEEDGYKWSLTRDTHSNFKCITQLIKKQGYK